MAFQTPYPVWGHVYINVRSGGADVWTAQRGAIVWAQDISEGTFKYREKDVSLVYTNTEGEFIIDIANITSAYSQGDTVRVYCKFQNYYTYKDVRVSTQIGLTNVDFKFKNPSGMKHGTKPTLDADGQYGLESIGKGMKKGLKEGLTNTQG